jgi:hypothetical protein
LLVALLAVLALKVMVDLAPPEAVALVDIGHLLLDITLVVAQAQKLKFLQPLEQHTPLLLALAGQQ